MLQIIKVGATWCRPCTVLERSLEPVVNEYASEVNYVKIDIDQDPEASEIWAITSIPTVIFVKEEEDVFRFTGLKSKAEIRAIIEMFR